MTKNKIKLRRIRNKFYKLWRKTPARYQSNWMRVNPFNLKWKDFIKQQRVEEVHLNFKVLFKKYFA